jgi:hypothetical protein
LHQRQALKLKKKLALQNLVLQYHRVLSKVQEQKLEDFEHF